LTHNNFRILEKSHTAYFGMTPFARRGGFFPGRELIDESAGPK